MYITTKSYMDTRPPFAIPTDPRRVDKGETPLCRTRTQTNPGAGPLWPGTDGATSVARTCLAQRSRWRRLAAWGTASQRRCGWVLPGQCCQRRCQPTQTQSERSCPTHCPSPCPACRLCLDCGTRRRRGPVESDGVIKLERFRTNARQSA